jgi:hypothetical protein
MGAGAARAQENARAALDWPGLYRGVAPCAPPCSGVETKLYLARPTKAPHYVLIETRHGRGARPERTEGEARWLDGARLSVMSRSGERIFHIGEGKAFLLRAGQSQIKRALARLTKISDATQP